MHRKKWKRFPVLLFFLLSGVMAEEPEDPVRAAAEAGDVRAQFRLANEYFTGTADRKRNFTLAAHWFLAVAEKGYPEGMFNYAICLDQGLGVERDPFLAAEYYRKAAEKGNIPCAVFNYAGILRKGVTVRDEKDRRKMPEGYSFVPREKEAEALLEQLAEKNYAPARAELAEILLLRRKEGGGDDVRIFQLLTGAAESPEAPPKTFRMLADCYYGGIGTRTDPEAMIRCLQTAADRGDAVAMVKLAYCYEFGLNVMADGAKSFSLYRKAADRGIAAAQCKVAEAIEKGVFRDPDGLGAADWYARAALQDWPQACFRLAEIRFAGPSASGKELDSALKLLRRAAEKDLPRAQYRLGLLYLEPDSPAGYDPTAAVYWFRRGAENGDLPSMRELARCLFAGKGCDPNRAEARQWLRAAAREGDVLAEQMLKEP